MNLFKLRGELSSSQRLIWGIVGFILFLAVWWIAAELNAEYKPVLDLDEESMYLPSSLDSTINIDRDSLARVDSLRYANATEFKKVYPLLPPPPRVLSVIPEMVKPGSSDQLWQNTLKSIWLNLRGYFWAVFFSLLFGFLIGLFPIFFGLFNWQVNAMRYLPLTALLGLFTLWFGTKDGMKISFLAFGIIVYLLPVVVQRLQEVSSVYTKTVFTLGASDWQTIKSVYIPAVMSKLIDDIRVLTAISWTYIIIAEYANRTGGLGSLIFQKQRFGQTDKLFAILLIIIVIGFLQDRIFIYFDRRLFPYKYDKTTLPGLKESQYGIFTILGATMLALLLAVFIPAFQNVMGTVLGLIIVASLVIIAFGEFKIFGARRQQIGQ